MLVKARRSIKLKTILFHSSKAGRAVEIYFGVVYISFYYLELEKKGEGLGIFAESIFVIFIPYNFGGSDWDMSL